MSSNQLTSWSRTLPENLITAQVVNKFPAFHGNEIFIIIFIITCHWWVLVMNCTNTVHILTSYF